jgi:hypothetical protein
VKTFGQMPLLLHDLLKKAQIAPNEQSQGAITFKLILVLTTVASFCDNIPLYSVES